MVARDQRAGETRPLLFQDLPGWGADDPDEALAIAGMQGPLDETLFALREVETRFTGYFEPVYGAARARNGPYQTPIHRLPDPAPDPWPPRAEIDLTGHEIAWLADPLDAFFLQVQGSGRLAFEDGNTLRVGYAGKNGHPYVSIGKLLVEIGEIPAAEISAQAIRAWCAAHPDRFTELLNQNPSYVMFRELDLPPEAGPLGAMGKPLTPLRSIAVDPDVVPLGSLVWVTWPECSRLMVAQDIGSAIKGARADVFCGTGDAAGEVAGRLNAQGTMWILEPKG